MNNVSFVNTVLGCLLGWHTFIIGQRQCISLSFKIDVLITMIRPSHGYWLVIKISLLSTLSFKIDVLITMIRPSHGYWLVKKISLLSTLSFKTDVSFCQHFQLKKVTLTKLVNVNVNTTNVHLLLKKLRRMEDNVSYHLWRSSEGSLQRQMREGKGSSVVLETLYSHKAL